MFLDSKTVFPNQKQEEKDLIQKPQSSTKTEGLDASNNYDINNKPVNNNTKKNINNVKNQNKSETSLNEKASKIDIKQSQEQENVVSIEQLTNQLNEFKQQIQDLQQQLSHQKKEAQDELLKNQAELINFKKRTQQQKNNELKYASSNLIANLLMPLEQLEKVLELPTDNELLKKYLLGFQIIQQQIKNVLKEEGVEEIKALDQLFDPSLHHALETVSDAQKPNKTNLLVLQKGYFYKERILKPAMVKVNEWSNENEENK